MKTSQRLKMRMTVVVALLALSGTSLSAMAKTTTDDFNSLIEENATAQRALSKDLEKQLNTTDLRKQKNPNFKQVGEDVLGHGSAENVAVDSGHKKAPKTVAQKNLEKKNFNRLSQELKELK